MRSDELAVVLVGTDSQLVSPKLDAKTVLQIIETGGPGGAERMLVHLASGLDPEYRSEAALIRDSWLGNALRRRGIPVTMLRHSPRAFSGTLWDLVRLIRLSKAAILHSHEFFMNTVGCLASQLTGVPLVATVHEKNYYPDRFRRRFAYRLVGRFAGRLVTVSEDNKRFLAERIGIPHNRVRVVPNGVPLGENASEATISGLRNALGLNHHEIVIGTVGRLHPKKGHEYLLDAVPQVIRRFPHADFLIVGRGELREELEARADRLGIASHLQFLGHRDDVQILLSLCDIFVLPSLSEGMPLALLEAMAAGVPAVATQVGGVAEVVEDRKTGLLVPPGDSRALADGIMTLLENRPFARELAEAARQVVASRFSLTGMLHAYQDIYSELIR